jgi:hypothetical protein
MLWLWEEKIKFYLRYLFAYLAIAGLVTFSLFLHEEAIQTAIWGTWPAQDAKQWRLVKNGTELISSINTSMKVVNYMFGWIQPLALISYYRYAQATDYYIESLRAKVFANAPELYIGEKVKFEFNPREIKILNDGRYLAVNGKIGVFLQQNTAPFKKIAVEGILKQDDKLLTIEQTQ